MKKSHSFYSKLAFNLAENHLGQTAENPSVGCVIVKNDSVISSGVTSINGRPHAEYNALNKNLNFSKSTMYLTLEPCTHYGLTPPCTDIIKRKKVKNIFYCFEDLDKRTHKKAKKVLGKSNIKLKKVDVFNNFYKSYYLNKLKNLPLIDAKIAISKDFFTINKKKKWITNTRSRKVSHLLRSKYDSIISTSKSINIDNSLLNCRIKGLNNNKPNLIIIDVNLNLKKKLKLFKISQKRKVYIFTASKNGKKITYFKKKGIKIINIDKLESKIDFLNLLKKIYKLGVNRVLVETGLTFLNKLFKYKMINDLFFFQSNEKLRNLGKNNSSNSFIKKLKLNNKINVNLKNDSLYKIRIN